MQRAEARLRASISGAGYSRYLVRGTKDPLIVALLREREDSRTPLQRRLARLTRRLALAVLALCGIIFGVGLLRGDGARGDTGDLQSNPGMLLLRSRSAAWHPRACGWRRPAPARAVPLAAASARDRGAGVGRVSHFAGRATAGLRLNAVQAQDAQSIHAKRRWVGRSGWRGWCDWRYGSCFALQPFRIRLRTVG